MKQLGRLIDTKENSPRSHTPKTFHPDWASPDQRCRAAIKAVGQYGQVIPLKNGPERHAIDES